MDSRRTHQSALKSREHRPFSVMWLVNQAQAILPCTGLIRKMRWPCMLGFGTRRVLWGWALLNAQASGSPTSSLLRLEPLRAVLQAGPSLGPGRTIRNRTNAVSPACCEPHQTSSCTWGTCSMVGTGRFVEKLLSPLSLRPYAPPCFSLKFDPVG